MEHGDMHSRARLLQSFNSHHLIQQGRQLHLFFLKRGALSYAITIANRVLQMYVKCSHMRDAQKLFDEMTQRNCFTWNTMLEGYLNLGNNKKSLELFDLMPHKNHFTWNLAVSGFAKAGELEIAARLFHQMPTKNGIAWNSVIHGYVSNGNPREALRLFKELSSDPFDLSRGDTFVLATAIGACTDMVALDFGKQIHARIVIDQLELDSVLISSLINFYGKCGDLNSASHILNLTQNPDDFSLSAMISGYANCGRMEDARKIFNVRSFPCVVLWNNMIAGYVDNGEANEALVLFNKMRTEGTLEDYSTFATVLSACSNLGILKYCKQLHTHAFKFGIIHDLIVASSVVDSYAKCGSTNDAHKLFTELKIRDTILLNSMITIYSNCGRIEDAKQIFESIQFKSLISWNSMIVGFSQNGCAMEALDLFCKMNKMGMSTDKFSLASVISACASISSLELGEQVFTKAIISGLDHDEIVSTSLIDLYCKCGSVEKGRNIFDHMMRSDEVPWNSMLMGYATNGYGIEALNLFDKMRCMGIFPTEITFTGVLSACNHCGLVGEAQKLFCAMKHCYHIDPGIEHYSCMVDLLSRAGCLEEAMNLIEEMPFEADSSMWSSVLRGCLAHRNQSLGKNVAERITGLDPENSDAYVQLSSIFASSGEWERSAQVRKLMRDKRLQKNPGYSWTECGQNL